MSEYIVFVVVDCKSRNILLVTSSAKKAKALLSKGIRIEVWSDNRMVEKIYSTHKNDESHPIGRYLDRERAYIGRKQVRAEQRNRRKQKVVS